MIKLYYAMQDRASPFSGCRWPPWPKERCRH